MASGTGSFGPGERAYRCLNSCSGEVWPRGSLHPSEKQQARSGLNSCSGEVWPRGLPCCQCPKNGRRVSILVLVKYGLGAMRVASPLPAMLPVSILVLVKYGLGGEQRLSDAPCTQQVSILVLVKYGLGVTEEQGIWWAQELTSQFLFW